MKIYTHKDAPMRVYGVPHFEETQELRRLPDEVLDLPEMANIKHHKLGLRTPGARIRFRTDSQHVNLKLDIVPSFDIGMSVWATQAAYVYAGENGKERFVGLVAGAKYEDAVFEKMLDKGEGMEDVTVYLPRNVHVNNVEIGVDDGATVEPPTPYRYEKPIVFYGSSITEGGCATIHTNAYTAKVARHLDADHVNLGFSGNARGELCMADYVNTLDMSVFVLDYDHNAPDVEHLAKTHEPFFLRVREHNPELPIVLMTRPNDVQDPLGRLAVVKKTYENALARGDKNVYFINGRDFFGEEDHAYYTIDGVHPNDLGFARMTALVEPVLRRILES